MNDIAKRICCPLIGLALASGLFLSLSPSAAAAPAGGTVIRLAEIDGSDDLGDTPADEDGSYGNDGLTGSNDGSDSEGTDASAPAAKAETKGVAGGSSVTIKAPTPMGDVSLAGAIGRIIRTVLGLAGAIALLIFVYAGFTMMTAAGSSSKVEKAKETMVWAAIGLIGLFASYAAVNFVITKLLSV